MSLIKDLLVRCAIMSGGVLCVFNPAQGAKLWSTDESFLGSGEFFGPGKFIEKQELFHITLNNLSFFTPLDFVTPWENNGTDEPNICGEKEFKGDVDGKLSNGIRINENVDICSTHIAGTHMMLAVIEGGPHQGQQFNITMDDGNVVMTMDFALDLGIGEEGIIKLPFFGTTGVIEVPLSLQTQMGKKGIDQAGKFPSKTRLTGRIGDFNNDGWIDGAMVAAGTMPLTSPFFPGQPYALLRNFETNIAIDGLLHGNIKDLKIDQRIILRRE